MAKVYCGKEECIFNINKQCSAMKIFVASCKEEKINEEINENGNI